RCARRRSPRVAILASTLQENAETSLRLRVDRTACPCEVEHDVTQRLIGCACARHALQRAQVTAHGGEGSSRYWPRKRATRSEDVRVRSVRVREPTQHETQIAWRAHRWSDDRLGECEQRDDPAAKERCSSVVER